MDYFIAFLEGVITFISPCLLPMLPVYISYFAGGKEERTTSSTLKGALGFILGFTVMFVLMGALAGTFGSFLTRHRVLVNIVTGLIVVFFGLSYLGVFKLSFLRGFGQKMQKRDRGFFSALLFGVVFSIGWTPCVGAFLGSALMLAASGGETVKGIVMLLLYSLGLGIPFLLCALLIDKLKGALTFIKKHYKVINTVCGILLIVVGILMMTGLLSKFIGTLA